MREMKTGQVWEIYNMARQAWFKADVMLIEDGIYATLNYQGMPGMSFVGEVSTITTAPDRYRLVRDVN